MSETKSFRCHKCGCSFSRTYGVDINGQALLCCNRCGKTLRVDFSAGWAPLPDCDCGGTFDADALGRCPQCGQLLSAEDIG